MKILILAVAIVMPKPIEIECPNDHVPVMDTQENKTYVKCVHKEIENTALSRVMDLLLREWHTDEHAKIETQEKVNDL